MTNWCQCEHESHPSEADDVLDRARTRTTENHIYGETVSPDELVKVKTIYGTFHICGACMQDHPLPQEFRAQ